MATKSIPIEDRVPIADRGTPDPRMTLADYETSLTLAETSAASGYTEQTVRRAIVKGELKAFTRKGANPQRLGKGGGYRVTRAEIERWLFNKPKGDKP